MTLKVWAAGSGVMHYAAGSDASVDAVTLCGVPVDHVWPRGRTLCGPGRVRCAWCERLLEARTAHDRAMVYAELTG